MIDVDDGPIIACSSGNSNNSAISLLRISGFKNLEQLSSFFNKDLTKLEKRKATLINIVKGAEVIDEVVAIYYPAPNSYNGENILELNVHGNLLNVRNILSLFVGSGIVRHANPGEFTRRALVNKKLSLSQVEGLDLFLNASSKYMLSAGLAGLYGELNDSYLELYDTFLKLKSMLELSFDFSEDVGESESNRLLNASFLNFFNRIEILNKRATADYSSLLSPEIVIAGRTNAGKSSLFNYLLSNDRSIVSDTHGTTRDYVSEHIIIEETNYRLVDTAGLRTSESYVEEKGIERANELLKRAFFKILVINPFDVEDDITEFSNDFDFIVFTHEDVEGFIERVKTITSKYKITEYLAVSLVQNGPIGPKDDNGPIGPKDNSGPIGPKDNSGPIGPKDNNGPIGPRETIEDKLKDLVSRKFNSLSEKRPIIIDRQRGIVANVFNQTVKIQEVMGCGDVGIISSELSILENSLFELIGIITTDDVLSSIFDNFCIGK